MTGRAVVVPLLLLGLVAPVFADDDAPAPAAEAPPARNFIYLRGGTSSIAWLIYTRNLGDFGRPAISLGLAPNPHNDYREYFAGLGVNLNKTHGGITPTLLYTHTTGGNYLEYWISPWVDRGRFVLQSFIGGYIPLEDDGADQFFIDPLTVLVKVNGRVAVGATYTDTFAEGAPAFRAIGPAVQVTIPKGVVIVDFLKGLENYDSEVRATVLLSF